MDLARHFGGDGPDEASRFPGHSSGDHAPGDVSGPLDLTQRRLSNSASFRTTVINWSMTDKAFQIVPTDPCNRSGTRIYQADLFKGPI